MKPFYRNFIVSDEKKTGMQYAEKVIFLLSFFNMYCNFFM